MCSPGASPYATSVGGTSLTLNADNEIVDQVVWNDCATVPGNCAGGGGRSSIYSRPSYQVAPGIEPSTDRLVPDVAFMAGDPGLAVYWYSAVSKEFYWSQGGGTSLADPLFAAGYLLITQATGRRLGNINPLLYLAANTSYKTNFYDITQGNNNPDDPEQPGACCSAGPLYDLAPGLGSVKMAAFTNFVKNAKTASGDSGCFISVVSGK